MLVVWLALVLATLSSAWLAEHHAIAGNWTAPAVMLIAALKGRGIVLHFMELNAAPLAWRIAFEVWIGIATAVIIVLWAAS